MGKGGARGRIRTADTAIFSRMLYQLSYPGREAGDLGGGRRHVQTNLRTAGPVR